MSDFIHLHCHSEYSLLQSMIKIPDLCSRAVELGMTAVALTDTHNLHGAIHFYKTAREYGLKPIIGCELSVAPGNDHAETISKPDRYHLTLLAMNKTGFHNLIKLSSLCLMNNPDQKPGVTRDQLGAHNDGLIALSGGISGQVSHVLEHFGMDKALNTAMEYSEIFPGRFYLEMQACGLSKQKKLGQQLAELSQASGLPLVATNDCRYLYDYESEYFETLLRLEKIDLPPETEQEGSLSTGFHFTTPDEMQKAFAHIPQALENTIHISRLCNLELNLSSRSVFMGSPPRGETWEDILRSNAQKGLERRIQTMDIEGESKRYYQRLGRELDSICSHGLAEHFVVLEDIVNWSRLHDIPIGPGRGEAPGSLLNYALGITNVDPIRFDLFFERFLNVQDSIFPDISIDFCQERRGEVFKHVRKIYGSDKAVPVITFTRRSFPWAVRETGAMMNIDLAVIESIANMKPFDKIPFASDNTLEDVLEINPDIREMIDSDRVLRQMLWSAWHLRGLIRRSSVHEAVIALANRSTDEAVPLCRNQADEPLSQWDEQSLNKLRIPCFVFLGLKNLTMNRKIAELAESKGKNVPDLDLLPLDDAATLAVFDRADTKGVFNFESRGISDLLSQSAPNSFEDIAALYALYRPGQSESDMVEEFIARKQGKTTIQYPHPLLEPVLRETYGIIVYQEQLIRTGRVLAGYSLEEANMLQNGLVQRHGSDMTSLKESFMLGCMGNSVDRGNAGLVFDLMEGLAAHSFSKAHAVAYSMISFQTAYLKAHFPDEFMAAYEAIFNRA